MMKEYRLDEIYHLQMGKTPSRDNIKYWQNGKYEWVSIADLTKTGKYISDTKEKLSDSAVEESGIKVVPQDTVIMSFKLSIGKTAICTKPIYTNEAIMAFIDKKVEKIIPQYAYYLLSAQDWNKGTNRAVMGATLNKATLSNYRIRIHDYVEQEKIVAELDKVTEVIAKRKAQLEELNNLVKSQFIEMFGDIYTTTKWDKFSWSDLVRIQNGKDYKSIAIKEGGYPVYGTGGEMARAREYLCPENTIIVGRKGTINNPLLVKEKFWNVDTAFGVIVGEKLNYQYFYGFCKMFDFSTLNKQAVLPSTTKADLLKIRMPVPPIELQNKFARFVEQTDKSKFRIKESLENLENCYKALLQKYFG